MRYFTPVHEPAKDGRRTRDTDKPAKPTIYSLVKDLWDGDIAVVKAAMSTLADICDKIPKEERSSEKVPRTQGNNTVDMTLTFDEGDEIETVVTAKKKLRPRVFAAGSGDYGQNRKDIGRIGGPLVIVKAMERHYTDCDVQKEGCRILANLASDADVDRLLVEVDAMEAVIVAMKNFPQDSYLQDNACRFWRNTARKSKVTGVRVTLFCIPVIIAAMKAHLKNEKIQLIAGAALNEVALHGGKDAVKAIFSSGGLSALASSAENHSDNPELKLTILAVLLDQVRLMTDST